MKNAIEQVKHILAKIKRSPALADELSDSANIIDDVGLDSLEMLQFMLEVEEKMAIQIDFDRLEYEHLYSIKVLVEFLESMPSHSSALSS